jgi:hypothetical protein
MMTRHPPRRHRAATIGALLFGITLGVIAGITSRPTRLSIFDRGPDDRNPLPASTNVTAGTETAPPHEKTMP